MQGVLKNQRVRLLFSKGMPCYRERRNGMRKRKSVRGCIVGHDLAILNLLLVKEGEQPIAGLTDGTPVRRLGIDCLYSLFGRSSLLLRCTN